ncbi:hypothetical protein K3172_12955 [Qipengyuania sp. 6B39]|uniref:hypothetical protein n=1 Tax=Qipengyuania proteolytica TaxID=2867239 RepID=UPI001C8AADF4|nr:hypothetical protein [Qipengyuania proteolytica]MBX7496768.1 hypothetical protein [Qipengyuania proteolytica]
MKVKALDTIRVSSAGGRKEKGETFEVNDHEGKELVERGLVKKVPAEKAAPKPKAKVAKKPENKSA